jgi:hypothetical protein
MVVRGSREGAGHSGAGLQQRWQVRPVQAGSRASTLASFAILGQSSCTEAGRRDGVAIIRSLPAKWRVEAVKSAAKYRGQGRDSIEGRYFLEETRRGLVSLMMAWRPPRSALLLVLRERTVNREVTTDAIKKAAHPRGLLGIILRGS